MHGGGEGFPFLMHVPWMVRVSLYSTMGGIDLKVHCRPGNQLVVQKHVMGRESRACLGSRNRVAIDYYGDDRNAAHGGARLSHEHAA
jgi:hypothetical protein